MALFKRRARAATDPAPTTSSGRRTISLALQGGGAHGAFQWGVLDRLLEDDRMDVRAVTASSAGAMNGAALVSGLAAGGPAGARTALDKLWREVNQSGGRNVVGDSSIWSAALSPPGWLKDTPLWRAGETMAMSMSPYEFNPLNLNPMKRVLDAAVDFEAVRASDVSLIIAATAVRHARARLFRTPEITAQVLMATSCLPHLFQAVEIDGEPYWDGGYMANPPLWPLFDEGLPDDVLLITLNPIERDEAPRTAGDIVDRLNEIAFNAPLMAELRAIAIVQDLLDSGRLTGDAGGQYRSMRLHAVDADAWLSDQTLSSKFNTEWTHLNRLKVRGRDAASEWLESCFDAVGCHSSIDIQAKFG